MLNAANFAKETEAFKLQAGEAQTCFDRDPEKMAALGNSGAKIALKEHDVPTSFPVVEAMSMSSVEPEV